MKIRKGFVTNSSSSSFVIGFKSEGLRETEEAMESVPVIFKSSYLMVKQLFDFDNAITTEEELDGHFIYQYGWSQARTIKDILKDDDYLTDKYNKMMEYINDGYGIVDISVDYNDETLSGLLRSLPKKDSEIILIREEY